MARSELLNTIAVRDCAGCDGIDRREFLSKTALAAALFALAACSTASDITVPTPINNSTVKLSDHTQLETVGGIASFTLNDTPIAVVRTGESTFVALSRVCPHQGSTVNANGDGNGFTCPNHGAMFTKTGAWAGGQPTSSMRSFPVVFDATAGTLKIG